jgi:hypothetical protein
MNSQAKLLLGGALAVLLGIAAALFLQNGETQTEPEIAPSKQGASVASRIETLQKDEIPEEHQGTEKFLDDRWGHLGLQPETAVKTDPAGERFFIDRRVHVGVGRGGQKVYARAIHRAVYAPNIPRATYGQAGSKPGPKVTTTYKPGAAIQKLQAMDLKPITDPDDMPDHLRDMHPLAKVKPKAE